RKTGVKLIKGRAWTTSKLIFEACDEDNKGYLSRENFKVAVVMFGYKPSKGDLFVFYIFLSLLFEKFLNLMSAMKDAQLYSNETRKMFSAFLNIMSVLHNVFWVLNTKSLLSYREVDQDSDHRISFKEFESAMKYGQDEVSPVYFA
uniref:EF-hand calcium binding domain 11 n=1 Tax=Aquila chrysaetos chrysaetos TaxID=223781 RepID=A0A663E0P1_AQUCH